MTRLAVSCSHRPLHGQAAVPGDKSISHRALLLGALADGTSEISGFVPCGDCLSTLACLEALGVRVVRVSETSLLVDGRGLLGLGAPIAPLDCGRSATTMRLLAGILAGQPFSSVLTGHEQLLRRPMGRVVEPLCIMGAQIEASAGRAPLVIVGRQLQARQHRLSVASAQVKSSILLAGLYADGRTTVVQPGPARDHTERMLAWMDVDVEIAGLEVALSPPARLSSVALQVPGDISLAAFPMVASVLVPGSEVTITGVGLNPTRTGLLDALQSMGAWVNVRNRCQAGNEPVADLTVRAAALEGVSIAGDTVVRMIDEFPILAVAATQAEGTTTVQDAAELRVKETDRIATVVAELRKMGACIDSQPDGFVISGPTPLHGALVNSHGDHRLAMALAIAGLIAEGQTLIENTACIADSFPGFEGCMRNVGASYD